MCKGACENRCEKKCDKVTLIKLHKPRVVLHNDQTQFMCLDCGVIVDRTRSNPYPDIIHKANCGK